jgi:methionyl-tRNA formyltransferase
MGTPEFAVPSLEILDKNGHTISAVVTTPDKERGRGQQMSFTAVKRAALDAGYPVLQPVSLKDPSFADALRESAADVFVVVAFRILPREIHTIPPKGSFNLHASLLPKYRGAAPINWALMNGETESGVTTFFLQDAVDTGSIILQSRITIQEDMTAGELHDQLAVLGAGSVLQTVNLIQAGNVVPLPQSNSGATPAPKIFRDDCRIRWDRTIREIHNHVRGLSPYPAAWTVHRGKVIKIYRTRTAAVMMPVLESGSVFAHEGRLFAVAADGPIEILEIQQEGKRRMTAEEFLRGYTVNTGEKFDSL